MPPSSSHVRVVVRCKPKEDPTSDHLTAVDLPEMCSWLTQTPGNSTIILQKGGNPQDGLYQFSFTRVLDDKDQTYVYDVCGKDMVSSVLDGFNCTVMAYGQTGSGKTYTMTGPEGKGGMTDTVRQGLVPRLVAQIFSEIGRRRMDAKVRCSYIEIYNEHFRDLLAEGPSETNEIGITEIGKRICLKGAVEPVISSAGAAISQLMKGEAKRHVAGHGMNTRSSRSHTIFTMLVETTAPSGQKHSSKLNLVDLAGSERANKTGVSGAVAREALYINKSLTFLEQVIVALAKKNVGHVPYRSSKLTHFLKDSLGGNCKTLLIANIWNSYQQINETISTCRFAHRMMQVTEDAHANEGGFNSVHGNLFKLDPVMQGYLETVTAAAVAREKAKLMLQFQRQGLNREEGSEIDQLSTHERDELEGLRSKVTELEEMQEMAKVASEAARNGVVVDRETLEEMEALRKRLLELEAENVVKSLDDQGRSVEELEEELQTLRQQVTELKDHQTKPAEDTSEVERLRAQVREMQEKEIQRQQAEKTPSAQEDNITEDELKELMKLKELRDRARELQAREGELSDLEAQELDQLTDAVREIGISAPLATVRTPEHYEEVEDLRNRVDQLEAANALGHSTMGGEPLTSRAHDAITSRDGNTYVIPMSDSGNHIALADGNWVLDSNGNPKKKKSTLGKLRKSLTKVLKGGKTNRSTSKSLSGMDSGEAPSIEPQSNLTTPRPQQATPTPGATPLPVAASTNGQPQDPNEAPNIVILNSLTHLQLLELLNGAQAAGSEVAYEPSTDTQNLKAIVVPSPAVAPE